MNTLRWAVQVLLAVTINIAAKVLAALAVQWAARSAGLSAPLLPILLCLGVVPWATRARR